MPQQATADDSELGLSLARRFHPSRRLPTTTTMTLSTGAPLRSITARPLAHISSTTATTTTTSTADTSDAAPPSDSSSTVADALAPTPSLANTDTAMRSFAVIVCTECLYLEFPGCDVHGVLYTKRAPDEDTNPGPFSPRPSTTTPPPPPPPTPSTAAAPFHAKCPKCTAATNNVRPFREGCRRCKAATTVHMWCSTLSEIAQAYQAFPTGCEEMEHSTLSCELCKSVVFPRARGSLTKRTMDHAIMSTNGKVLKVSNFQRSMPHVEGCPRKGMPSQTIAVQLTKSELTFVLERLLHCPVTPRIVGGPQYRKRPQQVITQQNHLHQIYLRLLSTVVRSFDPLSPNAMDPLHKIVSLLQQIEPMALFHEWSPPQVLSTAQHKPHRVEASSILDDQHGADNVLHQSEGCWRPKTSSSLTTDQASTATSEWIQFQFNPTVALASVELQWHVDLLPARYSVLVTQDDGIVNTVAVVVDGRAQQAIPFAQRSSVASVRVVVFGQADKGMTCGLETVTFYDAGVDTQRVSNESVLQDLQGWLLSAATSSTESVRDTALTGLQRLALASGSLCGLMQLATSLLLNTCRMNAAMAGRSLDEQDWNRLDRLSDEAHEAATVFLGQLAKNVLTIMVANDTPQAGENSLVEKHVLEQIVKTLNQSHDTLSTNTSSPKRSVQRLPSPKSVCPATDGEQSESPLYPYLTMAACQSSFSDAITRRSQLGMIILMIVSELSAWQMKRMQKGEEFAGKKEEELMQLEEPFSLEVRPRFWELSHRLLSHVLDPWVTASSQSSARVRTLEKHEEEAKNDSTPEEFTFDHEVKHTLGIDLYDALNQSFDVLGASLADSGYLGSSHTNHKPKFTPDTTCVGILQIITSNIRRLVLSRADPMDIEMDSDRGVPSGSADAAVASPALEPIIHKLEQLISLGTKRSDKFFTLSLKAAAAVEVGMEAFYPSAQQRTQLLTSRMGTGSTLEVQVRWPVQERDQEDPRYERLILMLQFECIRMGFTHAIRGRWQFFMHLVVQVPESIDTMEVLQRHFAPCIQQTGFAPWQVVAGAQEISINLQRHLHWNRVEKMSHDSGAGWIRVYPRDVAIFEDVIADVDLFLSDHDKRAAAKMTVRP